MSLLFLKNHHTSIQIDQGELISFQNNNIEYIHQKGSKGWRNSDDEMFPIIGPTVDNNFTIQTPKGKAVQDQHGLLRELKYTFFSSDKNSAKFIKKYKKNTPILNSKFPKKSSKKELFWPYDFTFEKIFTLKNNTLKIEFIINSPKEMPFMLGYHPAFLLSNSANELLITKNKKVTLKEVINAGANAFPLLNTKSVILKNFEKNNLEISTKGFTHFMLWTTVNNMLCIEPITHYPTNNQKDKETKMNISTGKDVFSIKIEII